MNRFVIKNKGYNNNSGINYLNCGMNQFSKNEDPQVDMVDSATFENTQREKYLEKTMNEDFNIEDSTTMDKQDKAIKRDLEIKEDPNLGTGNLRIDNTEKNAMKLQNKVAVTNFKADDMLNKNIPLVSG